MSWLKQSDVSANHPITLRALEMEEADDRILNEVYGWVNRCATQSAAFDQDYIVTVGTARAMAGSFARFDALSKAAIFCGYFTEVMIEVEGEQRKAFKLVEEQDLFHMILKAEKDWTKQRQADNRNVSKTGPVRLRDGDACRYCGRTVTWGQDRRSVRKGSIDHVVPGAEGTIETMVVCCNECNSRRKDDPESTWKTLPAPVEPLIGDITARWLTDKCGIPTKPSYNRTPTTPVPPAATNGPQVIEEPTAVEHPAMGVPAKDDAPVAVSDASIGSTTSRPGATVEVPEATDRPASRSEQKPNSDHRSIKVEQSGRSGYAGSGRDGSGRVGTGSGGSGHHGSSSPVPRDQSKKPRKRRRGRPQERQPREY
ncbi:HNH endonuclease [Paeniglutamicibacter sp.]|uniref:HNH endonuclease n=1 Tax=Paeniglutamicibacter sp. TaxID=1934391 RepID=UPI0039898A78